MPMTTGYANKKISDKISEMSDKIDRLYALETLFREFESYVRDTTYKYDENGDLMKDENDDYITEHADTPKNKLLDECIEFLSKKYL